MALVNKNMALSQATPNVSSFDVNSPTMMCKVGAHFDPSEWTEHHKTAWEAIQNAIPDLNDGEREEVCARWRRITTVQTGKRGRVKCPTLQQVLKLALYCEELQANRYRVRYGSTMRKRRAARRSFVHHANGGYTARMLKTTKKNGEPKKVQRKNEVAVGEKIRRQGWTRRIQGKMKRKIVAAALLKGAKAGTVQMGLKTAARLQRAAGSAAAEADDIEEDKQE